MPNVFTKSVNDRSQVAKFDLGCRPFVHIGIVGVGSKRRSDVFDVESQIAEFAKYGSVTDK